MAGAVSAVEQPLKIITGADDFGASLKDAMVSHLRSLGIDVEDTGVSSYYSARPPDLKSAAASQLHLPRSLRRHLSLGRRRRERSINQQLQRPRTLRIKTSPETAVEIFDAWIKTPFKSPCPASGSEPWSSDISSFLDNSLSEMAQIGESTAGDSTTKKIDETTASCAICCLTKNREFTPVDIMPGGSMKIVRETPTSAIVRFKAGSVEPAHHHTFGHDLVVIKGKKSVWNLSKKERADLIVGDYLFTPAGDVHRVKYHEDTEFFITWDGHWDIFLDEDLETAKKSIEEEA
ncbi:Sugar-phosphate isomerase RpiB/LacA/LacB superfamily [Arabidopsis thaliana x Arabidopsis arenosa]|uniref:Sugar-phosphate isomerase RpiB/LacA/LacB superfamily n=1 Tax=Arabidopsis thaliana x Arabidopsis arenosa TaxID=1240361 RepID=A0A8T2APX5_9BRAS|nr:Sugar-phosphate isomerase RpiB/LacA/LacB superfamily [Arabidopsis thaliana x Arabidopsis arenosa]